MLRKLGAWTLVLLFVLVAGASLEAGAAGARPLPAAGPSGPRTLTDAVPRLVRDGQAQAVGAHAPDAPLHLLFMLPMRDMAALDRFLADAGNPHSPNFGHYLTLDEANARFNPDVAHEKSVLDWLRANGIADVATPPNHLYVEARGSTAAFNALLGITIQDYRAGDRSFYGPDKAPTLPAAVSADVTWITGLSNDIELRTTANGTANGHPPYYPQDLANAYNANPLWATGATGAGSSVAIVLWGTPPGDAALNAWGSATQAAVATRANGRLVVTQVGNAACSTGGEAGLDVEAAGAFAYQAQIRYYQAGASLSGGGCAADLTSMATALNRAATDSGNSRQISNSWGGNEELGLTNTFDSILAANSATGHTYLFSSGDHGSHQPFGTRDPAPQYPASSRYVLSIGGTHFSSNIGSTWPGEAAWIYQASGPGGLPVGSGGGYSELYNRPSWQVAPGFNNTRRGYPDVAAVGDPNTGMFTCYGDTTPTCAQYGGTSLSAPLWAGMLAITDQYLVAQGRARTGFVNPLLYALSANAGPNPPYHDITSGTNGAYNAGAGWDAVTGLGTPDLWNLAQALLTLPAGTPTPTQTPPPVPPTNTPPGVVPTATPPPVPPTSTPPAATATACPAGQFSDVPPGSTFYTYITDLVNKGAISGYSDCTFRPSATITRGQVAKVIVLAFGFQLVTPAQPHFSDVPPGSAFYSYIETAYARGIISGYADGTFRWSNNVTRGQLTKMVSLGRGWRILTPAQPTFRDVPPTETFYSYIETTYAHGVISGYDCGTGCLEFRSSATSTRGQGAKIIDLSIYAADNTATPTTAPPTVPPTNTPPPGPTNTPAPTDTPAPTSTYTPVPPTATQTPTNTPSPTSTPTVRPTDTPQPAPYITGFQPNSVEQYDTETQISMTGNWFGMTQGAGFVVVNGRVVTVDTWDNTLIRFRITTAVNPASPAPVTVVRDDGLSATSTAFSVTARQRPYIFSYSPSALVHGDGTTVVTASGIRFGTTPGTVTLLGTYPATIVSWSNTQIQFRVDPNTPAANPISVIVNSPQNGSYTEFGRFAIFP